MNITVVLLNTVGVRVGEQGGAFAPKFGKIYFGLICNILTLFIFHTYTFIHILPLKLIKPLRAPVLNTNYDGS